MSSPDAEEFVEQIMGAMRDVPDTDPENRDYYTENYEQLQEEFPDEVVAIMDGGDAIVGSGDFEDTIAFFEYLEDSYGDEAVDRAYIEHVKDPDMFYIPG